MLYYYNNRINSAGYIRNLLELSLALGCEEFAIWRYPDSKENSKLKTDKFEANLNNNISGNRLIEKSTSYSGGSLVENATYYTLDDKIINFMVSNCKMLKSAFDSITTYKKDSKEWIMTIIFHENICIIKNVCPDELELLTSTDFKFSSSPPEHW